jgi:methionyl-tRNA formyltransferase
MTKTSETIVFFGSGPVAAASLKLVAQDFSIEVVVTKPQPSHHKDEFPVLKLANELGLDVLTTSSKEDLIQIFNNQAFKSRVGIVIDYGIIIPKEVIDSFPLGILNSHFSLLPRWRGADPISFAITSGDRQTGVSLMRIVEKLDEGPLLTQSAIGINTTDSADQLTDRLVTLSHQTILDNLVPYIDGQITPQPQPEEGVSYSRKLTKADSILDFHKTAEELQREIRAYISWPRSRTKLGKNDIIVTESHVELGEGSQGSLYRDKNKLGIYTQSGILVIDKLIPSGKKEMTIESFLAGYSV